MNAINELLRNLNEEYYFPSPSFFFQKEKIIRIAVVSPKYVYKMFFGFLKNFFMYYEERETRDPGNQNYLIFFDIMARMCSFFFFCGRR